jgi:prepilin-type N-terminal cleavage/methylation domain-containing protein
MIQRKDAFTLIELVVALVLGTLIMTTLMGVLRRSFNEFGAAATDDLIVLRNEWLVEQLRRDLSNARQMQVGMNRFELSGFVHRDPTTLISTHRPARVLYEIRSVEKLSVLFRIQTDSALTMTSQGGQLTEAIFIGAGTLQVSTNQIGAFSEADTIGLGEKALLNLMNQRNAVPSSVQIVLLDQRGRTIINQTFSRQQES